MTCHQLAHPDLRAALVVAGLPALVFVSMVGCVGGGGSGQDATSSATSDGEASTAAPATSTGSEAGTGFFGTTGEGDTSSGAVVTSESTTEAGPCAEVWEGDLTICMDNCLDTAVADVDMVRSVRQVTGRLTIVRSDLVDLSAFECLEEVGGLVIGRNEVLESLAGLEQLETIVAAPDEEESRIMILENPVLESLAGLESVGQVDILDVNDNALLASVGIPQLEELGGLYLGACGQISSKGSTALGDNPSLTALGGFDNLTTLGHLGIAGQNSLTSLDYLIDLVNNGVSITTADFRLNENLDIVEIEAFMAASGATGDVCGNAGGEIECMCPIDD